MREHTIKLYTIDELPEDIQAKIYENFRVNDPDLFHWADEWIDSLKAFCNQFGITLRDYEIGPDHRGNHVEWCIDDDAIAGLHGIRLFKYIRNNYDHLLQGDCPFTGYCGDESLIDPIRNFMQKPEQGYTMHDLVTDCVDAWMHGMLQDWEWHYSDEYIHELCQINEYEFTEEGVFY